MKFATKPMFIRRLKLRKRFYNLLDHFADFFCDGLDRFSFSKAKKILANSEMLFVSKKPDIDNLINSVLDPLNGIFYNDDKQVVKVTAEKRYSIIPRIAVKIEEIL